jgi:hypothetical protein
MNFLFKILSFVNGRYDEAVPTDKQNYLEKFFLTFVNVPQLSPPKLANF